MEFDDDEEVYISAAEDEMIDFDYEPADDMDDEDEMDDELELQIAQEGMEDEEAEENEQTDQATASQNALFALLANSTTAAGGSIISVDDIRRLFRGGLIRSGRVEEDDDADDIIDEEDETPIPRFIYRRQRPRVTEKWYAEVTEPQDAGDALLKGGEFGRLTPIMQREGSHQRTLSRQMRDQRLSGKNVVREDFARALVPNSSGSIVAEYESNPYSGQFSDDSSFYYTCCQDFRLHIYDTTVAPKIRNNRPEVHTTHEHETTMHTMKTVDGVHGRWTITDSHLSPDNERMIYSSITPTIYMTKTRDGTNEQIPIHLSDQPTLAGRPIWGYSYEDDNFGIYSCRFSADGTEIVAGGSKRDIFVYDLQGMRRTVRIPAHLEDVNSCCWADSSSGNILVSASDDTLLKVWDRRSLGSSVKPAGVLVGHTEGITYVSAKGDGRYIVSNSKDQSMRLWDLRKMKSNTDWEELPRKEYGVRGFDYRDNYYPKPRFPSGHPSDCSVMTYRGHAVFQTLIRCHFSPAESTGGSYLYTGSHDGRIHVYSLDGQIVQVIDRNQALPMTYDSSEPDPPSSDRRRVRRSTCVRDVSWHSREPVMMSVAWSNGYHDGGTVARHEWKGFGKNGMTLEDVIERDAVSDASP